MASDQQFCLRWNNHQNTLVSIFDSLLESGTLVDCTLAAEGRFLQAHKVVLSACSPYFAMLLREHYDKFPILILKDIKYQELQAMMNYMYRGEVNITQETLGSFLKAAESLQIRGLTDNSQCVENNNGIIRDNNSLHETRSLYSHTNKKLSADSRKLHGSSSAAASATPLISQQRSRSPPSFVTQTQSSKKYLKSSPVVIENHHHAAAAAVAAAAAAAVAAANTNNNSKSSSDMLENNSHNSTSIKRRKLLPPIKSEGLVVTPINPSSTPSTYNNIEVSNLCEVPSQAQSIPAFEGKANVPSPSIPPKIESPHMDITPVICNKVPPIVNNTPNAVAAAAAAAAMADGLIKSKSSTSDMVKVKSEQLDDSYNEDTNDDSYTTEDNDNERDENSHLSMAGLPFHNNQSGSNFDSSTDRSLLAQDGNNSLQDSPGEYVELIASDVVEVTQTVTNENTSSSSSSKALRRILKNISPDHHHVEYRGSSGSGKRGKKSTMCKAGCCTDGAGDTSSEHCSKKRFSPYQVEILKKEFAESPYISQSQAALIARKIGLKKLQVRKWFSDYRCKIKKQSITMEDESSLPLSFMQEENHLYDKDDESEGERIEVVDDEYAVAADYNKSPGSGAGTGGGGGLRKKMMKKRSKKSNVSNTDDDYDYDYDYDEQTNKKRFSPYQVEMLKKAFENSPYITQSEAAVIARNTGLKKMQVRKWFCDYRCKIKKQSLRLQRLQMLDEDKSKDGKFTKRQLSIRRLMRFHEQSRNENDLDIDVGEQYESKKIVRSGRKKSSAQNLGFNFTQEQLSILNEEFEKSQFITEERLSVLAEKLQEKRSTIKNWFTKKRYKTAESEQKFWTDLIEGSCDTAARITITREQNIKLQKLLHEKPVGKRKFTDIEIRKNASRLKIPAVKIRYWLKQRNALDEGPKSRSSSFSDTTDKRRKLLNELSFDQKVLLLKRTYSATNHSTHLTRELSREMQIDETRIYNWLKHKVHRNLHMKRSLSAEDIPSLKRKFAEYDYLDDDSALILADRFNVPIAVIKKAFQQHKPSPKSLAKSSILIKKLPEVALTRTSLKSKAVVSKKNPNFKTVDQKNLLFEAFRDSPTLTKNDTVAELVKATGLMPQQISKWLSVFRTKWAQNNESGLKKMLTRGLNQNQLVELEKAYRGDRFLSNTQLIELPKAVAMPMRAVQTWFSNRRVYEIRSCDKDLVNIGPKTVAARKEQSCPLQRPAPQPQSQSQQVIVQPQPADNGDDENVQFFESLSKEHKLLLKSACKNYCVNYIRLAQTFGVSAEKIKQYVQSYRIRYSIFRVSNRSLPERIHKALLNHVVKYGKISSKTSITLAKRLKMRPEQIRNWSRTYQQRILEHNRPAQQPAISAAPQPIDVEPVAIPQPVVEPATPTARLKSSAKKTVGTKYTVPSSAKIVLFEEYKKSPQAAATKTKQLAKVVGLTQIQVRKWLYNFGKKLSDHTKLEVVASLNNPAISDQVRVSLEAEYRNRRYLDVPEMEALAAEFGLARRLVESWFINARYYEVLTGQCPGSGDDSTASKSVTLSESFYESLDLEQRTRLNDELNSYPFDDERLLDLANELQVRWDDLKNWLDNASRSKTRSRSSPNAMLPINLTPKALETLINEFEVDPILSDARAGVLAKRIKVTKDRIKAWFANRQEAVEKIEPDEEKPFVDKIPPIRISIPKYVFPNGDTDFDSSKKSYFQQNRLFEEFKQNSTLTNERLSKISEDTKLDGKQILAWFDWIKAKLASIPKDSLLEENRNRNLTPRQIAVLEEEYSNNRYVDRSVREALSQSLGVQKSAVKSWFASKRYSEILCQDGSVDSDPLSSQDENYEEEDDVDEIETAMDFEWDEGTTFIDDSEFENKLDVKRQVEVDPLLDYSFEDDVKTNVSYNFQLSPNSLFTDDLTSLPYQPRNRVCTRLGKDLEPLDGEIEKLFWFASKTPNKIDDRFDQDIDEEKNRILESEFGKNPWLELERISELSTQLLISEPKIHWWFIKKRCFLTKTILNLPSPKPRPKSPPKNILIDLTGDDSESQPPKCGDFEFITLDETPRIKEEDEELTEEGDNLENGDPFENDFMEEQSSINKKPSQVTFVANVEEQSSVGGEPSQDPIDTIATEEQPSINAKSVDPIVETSVDPIVTDDTATNSTVVSASTTLATRKKTIKIPLTSHQRALLLQEFKRNKFIPNSQVRFLAQDLGLSVSRVERWFEHMSKKQKKTRPLETSASVKSLSPEIETGLEEEYLKSVNLSNKRAKMISIKLDTTKKIVQKWFAERAKRRNEQP